MTARKFWLGLVAWAMVLTLSPPPALALPHLKDLVRPGENLAALLPAHDVWRGVFYNPKKKLNTAATAEVTVDAKTGQVILVSSANFFHLRAVMDRTLLLKESVFSTTDRHANEKLGHDHRETRRIDDKLRIVYSKDGKPVKEKTASYAFFTLHLDVFQVTLQALLQKGVGDFATDVILGDRAWRAGAEFKRVKSRDFPALSPEYDFPEKFKRLAALPQDHIVYVMRLAGLLRLIYPHKFYCAFEADPPHRFTAYWGGEPEWVEYVVRSDLVDEAECPQTPPDTPEKK